MTATKKLLPWFSLATLAVLSSTIFINSLPFNALAASGSYFADISGHWAEPYVKILKDQCGIEGYANGTKLNLYKPDALATRAEMVKILVDCQKRSVVKAKTDPFTDVTIAHWGRDVIAKAKALDWVDGYKDGTFRPDSSVTRAEALKIILLSQYKTTEIVGDYTFTDVSKNAWYYKYIAFAALKNFASGYAGTKLFGPDNSITRGEIAKIIVNVLALADDLAITPPSATPPPATPPTATPPPATPPASPTPSSPVSSSVPHVGSCQIYPDDNPWNTNISNYPVHPMSDIYMATMAPDVVTFHTGFDNPAGSVVDSSQAKVNVECTPGVHYCKNSDVMTNGSPTPMPIPDDAEIENLGKPGSDRHLYVVDEDECLLYELFHANRIDDATGLALTTNDLTQISGSWHWQADAGGIYDLKSNTPPTAKKPSSTASSLPMYVGLAKYAEVSSGEMNHALMFAMPKVQTAYVAPAANYPVASGTNNSSYPPMGTRLRLKASFDLDTGYNGGPFTGQARVILETLKNYGMFLTDQGAKGVYIGGSTAPGDQWDYWPNLMQELGSIDFSKDLEVVDTGDLQT